MVEFGAIAESVSTSLPRTSATRAGSVRADWTPAAMRSRRRGRSTFVGNELQRADLVLDVALGNGDGRLHVGPGTVGEGADREDGRDRGRFGWWSAPGGARGRLVTRRTVNYVNTAAPVRQAPRAIPGRQAARGQHAHPDRKRAFLLASEALAKVQRGVSRPVELEWAKVVGCPSLQGTSPSPPISFTAEWGMRGSLICFGGRSARKLRQLELEAEVDRGLFATHLSRLIQVIKKTP